MITVSPVNDAPTAVTNNASVTVNEGQTAANAGTYFDVDLGDSDNITASVGTVTKNGTNGGTWSWSWATTDGPAQSQTVTITAGDGHGGVATTAFALIVDNVAPTATFNALSSIVYGNSLIVGLASPIDSSIADIAAGLHYTFAISTTNSSPLTAARYESSSTTASASFSQLGAGTYFSFARIIDADNGFTEYSQQVTVTPRPLLVTSDSKTKTYGTGFTAFTGSLAGVVASDGITIGSFSSAGAPAAAAVGAYTITATLTDSGGKLGNYAIANHYGTLTVVSISGYAYVLDASASGAVTLSGNASLAVPNGGVLMVDSTSSSAIMASGNAKITLGTGSSIKLPAGGGVRKSGNAVVPAFTVSGSTADPLAGLTPPTWSGTGSAVNVSGNSTQTINPGVYSSIKVAGNGVLKLNSGLYIIAGGGLSVTGNGSLKGTGVTIYNGGNAGSYGGIALSGNGTVQLTAADDNGLYPGTLIFQDRNNTRALSFSGNAMAGTSGTIYAKNALAGPERQRKHHSEPAGCRQPEHQRQWG